VEALAQGRSMPVFMDPGLAAALRPGMTVNGQRHPDRYFLISNTERKSRS